MNRIKFRLISLFLVIALLLTGCALDFRGYFEQLAAVFQPVTFENMTYSRPDITLLEDALANCLTQAEGKNLNKLLGSITSFNSICSRFQTNLSLAYIHYSIDMTDAYWETEYNFCSQLSPRVQAAVDELMYALADSSFRETLEGEEYFGAGAFDGYDGESHWTEEFIALMDRETELVNQYYELSSLSAMMDPQSETFYSTLGVRMEQVYVDLVKVRRQIATAAGFSSYAEYAYESSYSRDYAPTQATALMKEIRQELVPLYTALPQADIWAGMDQSTEDQTFRYVQSMAQSMGGMVQEAFSIMENGGLYHIRYGENKIGASYTTYLPDYGVPFIFMNPTMTAYDQLTFAHEFGHFCSNFASAGSTSDVDIAEIFSQAMELLSLSYADGGDALVQMKLADCLSVYVEQSFLADFEDRVYRMGSGELTVENVRKLYGQVATEYGLGGLVDNRNYVHVTHLFSHPMYVISYVVSQDAAIQFYQLEQKESGAGLNRYVNNLSSTTTGFLAFLYEIKLESPFEEGHIASVRQLLEAALK